MVTGPRSSPLSRAPLPFPSMISPIPMTTASEQVRAHPSYQAVTSLVQREKARSNTEPVSAGPFSLSGNVTMLSATATKRPLPQRPSPPTTSSFAMPPPVLFFVILLSASAGFLSGGSAAALPSIPQEPGAIMDRSEVETLFQVMETVSADRDWRVSNPDPCSPGSSWPGIECALGRDGLLHVTRLDFGTALNPKCKRTATFPSLIFSLPYVQSVFFFNCFKDRKTTLAAAGPAMAQATALQQLSLKSNPSLVGSIPSAISALRSLEILTLSQNQLQGKIPETISGLPSLVHLDLSYNTLTGTIPSQMGKLRRLTGLDLSYNLLTGAVPPSIGEMAALQKLDLSCNSLNGSLPESIEKLWSLSFLALSSNKLEGPLPGGLPKLRNLQYLIMDDNPMNMELPSQFGGLAGLQELRLANSGYRGPIPESFGRLANLTTLSLQSNRLTGAIPAGLGGLGRMYHMNLSRNMLSGTVPFDAGFLRRLGRNLDLSGNPGLCLNRSQGLESVKMGISVCDAGGNASAIQQPMRGRSHAAPTLLSPALPLLLITSLLLNMHRLLGDQPIPLLGIVLSIA